LQLYGSSVYGRFTLQDSTIFGSNNSALQIGGCSTDAAVLARLGDVPWLTLDNCLLLAGSVGNRTWYPAPPEAKFGITGSAINGAGRPNYLNARNVTAIGSLYVSLWNDVEDSHCTVIPRPAKQGGWVRDDSLIQITSAGIEAMGVPHPTDDYLRAIWGRPVPPPDPRVVDAVQRLDGAAHDLFAAQTDNGTDIETESLFWQAFRDTIPPNMR
jgi:hypothetical protein